MILSKRKPATLFCILEMQWRRLSHFGLLFNWELRAECRGSDPSVPLSLTSRDVPPPGTHSIPIGKVNYDVLQLSVTSITVKLAEGKIVHVLLI